MKYDVLEGLSVRSFVEKFPHNTDCTDKFETLINTAYILYMRDPIEKYELDIETFVRMCVSRYGGTIAGAMIDYLYNKLV